MLAVVVGVAAEGYRGRRLPGSPSVPVADVGPGAAVVTDGRLASHIIKGDVEAAARVQGEELPEW
jgi:hypothetical protein